MTRALPLVWLAPGCPLPDGLPPLSDLAEAAAGSPRLAVLAAAVGGADVAGTAARLAALPGCVLAGWLEVDRVVALQAGHPRTVLRRVRGGWEGGLALPAGAAAVLSAARLRLGRMGRDHGAP